MNQPQTTRTILLGLLLVAVPMALTAIPEASAAPSTSGAIYLPCHVTASVDTNRAPPVKYYEECGN